MNSNAKMLIIASKVRNPISGRFKVLRNWAKGLSAKLIVTNSSYEHEDLGAVQNGVRIEQVELEHLSDEIEVIDPTYIFVDDRDLDIISLFKGRKMISYVYPIHGLWGMPGLMTKNVTGTYNKFKIGTYRRVPHINLRRRYRKLEKESSCVIAQSHTAAGILRYYYGINPSLVLYNPVDRSIFKPLNSIGEKISSNEITLFLGSNNGDSDLNLIGEVAKLAKNIGFTLNTFGYEKNLVYALKNCESTQYFRKVSDGNLAEILSRSRFVVLPQVDEPASYVGIESISCGTPVIASYVDESIIIGETGYSADRESLMKIMKVLMKDKIEHEIYQQTLKHSDNFDAEMESKKLTSYLNAIDGDGVI